MSTQQLKTGLLPRHIQMMAIGGMIGTGIFKGSAESISIAGPGVVIAYAIGGLMLLVVMSALGEMASAYPSLDIRKLIQKALGPKVSFIMGWMYWINWVLVMAVEIVAAGSFLQFWFASTPLWLLALLVGAGLILLNITHVKNYGELEFWLAGIKVLCLVVFILLGGYLLFGPSTGATSPFANYTAHGGFLPNGWGGVLTSLLIVLFSYGGAEMIGVTVAETKDAQKVLPKVIKSVVFRVALFYILPLLIICGLVPWDELGQASSPFVQVLTAFGLDSAAHVMNFIMFTAVVSAANSGMYVTTRLLYSLATDGQAPHSFTRLSKQGVPVNALAISSLCLFIGALAAYLTPSNVFAYLMGIPGFVTLLLWITICLAQIKLRKSYTKLPLFHVRLFPYSNYMTIAALVIIMFAILTDLNNLISTVVCFGVLLLLVVLSLIRKTKPL
ncbi:amino acid permease [Brevibacillus sp. SYSU BS000544]|uniref:amino acid permease n=1 Tax=Brevibacillus sp. SYSU BS000544 TaxID=3416443 RepID=UPI003CE5858D